MREQSPSPVRKTPGTHHPVADMTNVQFLHFLASHFASTAQDEHVNRLLDLRGAIDAQAARIAELESFVEVLQNTKDRWSKRVDGVRVSETMRRNEVKACAFNEICRLVPTRAAAEAAKKGE
ncbi:MAG: hypothetical protein AAGF47_07075 [Planctomycetota bacterium]